MIVRDQMGRRIKISGIPQRIVSLVPSQTELLADLGLDEEVVGITEYCIHPAPWFETKTRIGGTKRIKIDEVKALKPDLIIANKEENIREQILELEEFAPVWISDVSDLNSALAMISEVAAIIGRQDNGAKLVQNITHAFEALKGDDAPRTVLYLIWRKPFMSIGNDTFIHAILERAGFINIMRGFTRYPEITGELILGLSPDLVFLSSEPFPFTEQHLPELQELWPEAEVVLVDGEMFSWYGSRLLKTPAYLQGLHDLITSRQNPLIAE